MPRTVLVCFLLSAVSTLATAAGALEANRTDVPVVVDGQLDADEWAGATRIDDFMQFEPTVGAPALQKTEAYTLYDSRSAYYFATNLLNTQLDGRLFGASIRRQITEGFNVEYELSRLWLDPDPEKAAPLRSPSARSKAIPSS
jgi:hypothetical protein